MNYRTKTYLAGDWDGDKDLISEIQKWNDSDRWALSFSDAHELKQARDGSLYCSIKNSLADRLNASKMFVLIVGKDTNILMAGSCKYCSSYFSSTGKCQRNMHVDFRSYIRFECEKAAKDYANGDMRIVVIYNYAYVHKDKCPEAVRNIGIHVPGIIRSFCGDRFNYPEIKKAIMG